MARKPALITRGEAAALLGVSPSYFSTLRKRQETLVPIYRAMGKMNYYKRSDVMGVKKFREKKKVKNPAAAANSNS